MRTVTSRRHPWSRGISTIEILVGASLSLFTIGTLFSFFQTQQRAMATQATYAQSQTVTRTIIDLFARELRMASYDPTTPGAIPATVGASCPGFKQAFVEATPTRLRFLQDLDGSGATDGTAEDLIYELVNGQVRRTDVNANGGAAVTLVSDVPTDGLRFRFFDGSNPPVELVPAGNPATLNQAQRNCIAKIRFTVRANLTNPDPNNPTPVRSVAESEVAVRNRSLLNF